MNLLNYRITKVILMSILCVLFANHLQGTNEQMDFVPDKMIIMSEKNRLSIEIQTLEEGSITKFKQIEILFQGRKISIPREDLADIKEVRINHWTVYTNANRSDSKDLMLEGELLLVMEYGPKIPRDANDKTGACSKVEFSFGKRGYGGRRRYIPTVGDDRWKVFEKKEGKPEEAAGETSMDFFGDNPQKV